MEDPIKLLETKETIVGGRRMVMDTFHHRQWGGDMSPVMTETYLRPKDAVAILIRDTTSDKFLFVQQCRIAMRHCDDAYPMEILAGGIDPGETPEEAGVREASEEAMVTLTPEQLQPLGVIYTSPGLSAEVIHLFYAETRHYTLPDHALGLNDEDVRICMLSLDEVTSYIMSGDINDAKSLAAVYRLILLLKK